MWRAWFTVSLGLLAHQVPLALATFHAFTGPIRIRSASNPGTIASALNSHWPTGSFGA